MSIEFLFPFPFGKLKNLHFLSPRKYQHFSNEGHAILIDRDTAPIGASENGVFGGSAVLQNGLVGSRGRGVVGVELKTDQIQSPEIF